MTVTRIEMSDIRARTQKRKRKRTYNAGVTVELGEAQESSDSVVIHMQESYGPMKTRTYNQPIYR